MARGYRAFADRVNRGDVPGMSNGRVVDRRAWFDTLLRHRIWFIERHYRVAEKAPPHRSVPMKLSHNNRILVKLWLWNTYVEPKPIRWLILKCRQMWNSTIIAALVHSEAKYGAGGSFLLTGYKYDPPIKVIYKKIQYAEGHMTKHDDLFVPTVGTNPIGSKDGLEWQYLDPETGEWEKTGGGLIIPRTGGFQSTTARVFWATEVGIPRAQDPQWEQLYQYSAQTVAHVPGTAIILEGTATGPRGFLWDMWRKKDERVEGVKLEPIFFPYFTHEEYRLPVTKDKFPEPIGQNDAERAEDEREMNRIRTEINRYYRIDRLDPAGWRYQYIERIREEAVNWRQHVGLPGMCDGDELFYRHEYPATPEEAFVGSGRGVYSERKIMVRIDGIRRAEEARKKLKVKPEFPGYIADEHGEFNTFVMHPPEPDATYVMGGDTSRGIKPNTIKDGAGKKTPGGDPLVFWFYNVERRRMDAVWKGWKSGAPLYDDIIDLATVYNNALMIIERTHDSGHNMNMALAAIRDDPRDPRSPRLYYHWNDYVPGFQLDRGNRKGAVDKLSLLIDSSEIEDIRFWQELFNFGPNNSDKLEGLDDAHDDMVMALVPIAWWMDENGLFLNRRVEATTYGEILRAKLTPQMEAEQEARKKALEAEAARRVVPVKYNFGDPLCRFMPRAKRPGVLV